MAVLALIESNTSGTGRLFARVAAENGVQPVLLTADADRYPYVVQDQLEVFQVNTQDEAAILSACRRLSSERGIAGVTSSSEYFVAAAAKIAGQLGLPAPESEAIASCRDKHSQRVRLAAERIDSPSFRLATSADEAVTAAEEIGFPVVLKPVYGSGSIGVKLCENAAAVKAHAGELLSQRENERGQPIPQRILVEELVMGQEYSVETFNMVAIGVTRKYLGSLPAFVEVGHDYPAVLNTELERSICQIALRALEALGLGWGPAHVEIRVTEDGPKIIEVNPRLAGGFIPELVRLASGVDLIAATVRQVIGREPSLTPQRNQYASIRFIVAQREGRLEAIDGLEEARRVPGVIRVETYNGNGRARLRGDFRDRLGHVIAVAETNEAARDAAETAHAELALVFQ
ncbi:MAG TPA: ATP-grasp domain-containing protein [Pyrinomonadaceae bacterium]|nr:ATP-grasp domain-containing protein [Pyrinomonadaceae bacterium]